MPSKGIRVPLSLPLSSLFPGHEVSGLAPSHTPYLITGPEAMGPANHELKPPELLVTES